MSARQAFDLLMALLFAASLCLQFNDPDPVRWIALYGAGSAIAFASFRGRKLSNVAWVLIVVCVIWMSLLGDSMAEFVRRGDIRLLAATMKADDTVIEETREFFGLFIVALYALLVAWPGRSPQPVQS